MLSNESAPEVNSRAVTMRTSSAGSVSAERALLARSSAREIHTENATLTLSAAANLQAGRDVVIAGGVAGLVRAADDVTVENGYVGALIGAQAHVEHGTVGLVIGRNVTVAPDARVLISTRDALLLLGGLALLLPLVRALLQRFFPPPAATVDERPWYRRLLSRVLRTGLRLGVLIAAGFLVYRTGRRRFEALIPAAWRT